MIEVADYTDPVLSLTEFGVAFREKVVLASVDLTIPKDGVTVLLGPGGAGKSTLLRTLAGFNDATPYLRTWGEARYLEQALKNDQRPALVSQSARLMLATVYENIVQGFPDRSGLTPLQLRQLATQMLEEAQIPEMVDRLDDPVMKLSLAKQRHLAIIRLCASGTRLLCIDEPTTGLSDDEAKALLAHIATESRRRAVLVVLHNLSQARQLGGRTAFLAGGVIQEVAECESFFSAPKKEATKTFIRTGSCSVPSPGAAPADLDPEAIPPAPIPKTASDYVSDSFGPRGFLWMIKGKLAGTPKPGIIHDLDYDLKALRRVGVTCLITLTQHRPDVEAMEKYGIENIWVPIRDMSTPSRTAAALLCRAIDLRMQMGKVIAVHCRAGLGLTGTLLAAYLIWQGESALNALEAARRIEPRWVQSEAQVAFLGSFAGALAKRAPLKSAKAGSVKNSKTLYGERINESR